MGVPDNVLHHEDSPSAVHPGALLPSLQHHGLLQLGEANVYCQQREQATLVEISNKEQLDFVQMEMGLLGGDYWWTSGTDNGREGAFAWMGSLNLVGDFIWYQNEPSGGYEHNCLCLDRFLSYFGADCECSYRTQVICQQVL